MTQVELNSPTGIAPEKARLMRLATYASVSVAVVLIVIKAWAWVGSGSIVLLSSLVDSILDALASMVNLIAVRHALEPADAEHRFGHGKLESLASLGQAAFIGGSAVFLVFEAGNRLIHPQAISGAGIGMAVMGVSIVLTLFLVIFQGYVVRRTGSIAISADSLHYRSDLLVNVGVIVALFAVSTMGWGYVDPVAALAVAIYILYGAWKIARQSFDMLMDREIPEQERRRIREIVMSHEDVHDMHDLRTRSAGVSSFIQFHIELDPDMTLLRAHDIADRVEFSIRDAYPEAEVIIHQDPHGYEEGHSDYT